MFTRLQQRVKEKTGRAAATRYSAEFEEQLRLVDALKEHTARIVTHTQGVVNVYGDPNAKGGSKAEGFAELCKMFADKLPQDEVYAKTLKNLAKVCKFGDTAERKFVKETHDQMCLPLQEWLKNECAELIKEREILNKKRLDMDAANTRLQQIINSGQADNPASDRESSVRSSKPADGERLTKKQALEERYERRRVAHDEQLRKVQQLCDKLDDHAKHHRQCLLTFVKAQGEYARGLEQTLNEVIQKTTP